jgi:hypothetical protein
MLTCYPDKVAFYERNNFIKLVPIIGDVYTMILDPWKDMPEDDGQLQFNLDTGAIE